MMPATSAKPRPNPSPNPDLPELNIEHASVGLDLPGLDRIVVIDRIGPAQFSQVFDRRLNIAGFVDRTRFQQGRSALPAPGQREFGQRLRAHRLVELRAFPIDAAVDGDVDTLDLAAAAPC